MNDTIIIMLNMRGSCAADSEKVHALFRINNRLCSAKRDSDRVEKHGPEISKLARTLGLPSGGVDRAHRSLREQQRGDRYCEVVNAAKSYSFIQPTTGGKDVLFA